MCGYFLTNNINPPYFKTLTHEVNGETHERCMLQKASESYVNSRFNICFLRSFVNWMYIYSIQYI